MTEKVKTSAPRSSPSRHTRQGSSSKNYFEASSKDPITDDYQITKQIGEGGFSIVKLGLAKRDNTEVAIKVVKKRKMTKEALEREVTLWKLALENCDHVVKLYGIYEDKHEVSLVMEMMNGGELFDRIVELEDYTEEYASGVVRQIAGIVMDIHRANVAHRDLKPENLLLQSKDSVKLKICDFGLAAMSESENDLNTIVGSRTYMAPEVFDKEKGHGKAVDLYAIGIIMYILLCGYPPFEPENGITELEFPSPEWDEISEEAKQLIAKLLAKDPTKRPLANQILRDPWIAGSPEIRRSRSKLFNTQRTLRRLKDLNKGDLQPGMTMKEFRGRAGQNTVFNLFPGIANEAEANRNTPKGSAPPAAAAAQAQAPAIPAQESKKEPETKKLPLESKPPAPALDDRTKSSKSSKPAAKKSPRDTKENGKKGDVTVEQLFLSFQRELRYQREQMEALRKDNLTLRAKLAEEQVFREELDARLSLQISTLKKEVGELLRKVALNGSD